MNYEPILLCSPYQHPLKSALSASAHVVLLQYNTKLPSVPPPALPLLHEIRGGGGAYTERLVLYYSR